jgi:hypothetical protein
LSCTSNHVLSAGTVLNLFSRLSVQLPGLTDMPAPRPAARSAESLFVNALTKAVAEATQRISFIMFGRAMDMRRAGATVTPAMLFRGAEDPLFKHVLRERDTAFNRMEGQLHPTAERRERIVAAVDRAVAIALQAVEADAEHYGTTAESEDGGAVDQTPNRAAKYAVPNSPESKQARSPPTKALAMVDGFSTVAGGDVIAVSETDAAATVSEWVPVSKATTTAERLYALLSVGGLLCTVSCRRLLCPCEQLFVSL